MQLNEETLGKAIEQASAGLVESLRPTIAEILHEEIRRVLTKTFMEGDFYRKVNDDLQKSLKDIYEEIRTARKDTGSVSGSEAGNTNALITEASDQLDAVLRTTEQATIEIMETIEKLQEMQAAVAHIVRSLESGGVTREDRIKLQDVNDAFGSDLLRIMTTLSFQDLTGQRIKIIIDTIRKIESIVLDTYMSTGLMIKAREEEPQKEFEELKKDAQTKTGELKGPQEDASQGDVDDLLASLGL